MKNKRISFRKIIASDTGRLVHIYNNMTNKRRTNEKWNHQWIKNHHANTRYYTIFDNKSETIVGGHGVLAFDLYSNDQDIIIGKTENTVIDPSFRGKILYPALEKEISRNYNKLYDIMFTGMVPNKKSSWRKKIGFKIELIWKIQKVLILCWRRKSNNYDISKDIKFVDKIQNIDKNDLFKIKLTKIFLEWRFKYENNILSIKDHENTFILILRVKRFFWFKKIDVLHFDSQSVFDWRDTITNVICNSFGIGIFYIKTSFTNINFSKKRAKNTLNISQRFVMRSSICKLDENTNLKPELIILTPLTYEGI